jgi:hypothetical protein
MQCDDGEHLLRKQFFTIVVKPLMVLRLAMARADERVPALQLLKQPWRKPFVDQVVRVVGHDAIPILCHPWPWPALELINVLIKLILEALYPRR